MRCISWVSACSWNFPYLYRSCLICQLSRDQVRDINLEGGSLLGVSRGGANIGEVVDNIEVI